MGVDKSNRIIYVESIVLLAIYLIAILFPVIATFFNIQLPVYSIIIVWICIGILVTYSEYNIDIILIPIGIFWTIEILFFYCDFIEKIAMCTLNI